MLVPYLEKAMGENSDGSSSAAQRAQPTGQDQTQSSSSGGVLRRIFGAFSPDNSDPDIINETAPALSEDNPTVSSPGLGALARLVVEDVSIPKADIVSVPSDISKADLVQVFRDSGLTRLPVYEGTLDTPIGLAHLKDFALKHGFNGTSGEFALKDMLRPLLFVPPSMPIGVLLQKMQDAFCNPKYYPIVLAQHHSALQLLWHELGNNDIP